MGLNHIPLKPMTIRVCIAKILYAFSQVATILGLDSENFPLALAKEWVRTTCLTRLKKAKNDNKFGFCTSQPDLFSIKVVQKEVEWITNNLYCVGLDKAANNIFFICIKHIRLLALQQLMSNDFHHTERITSGYLVRSWSKKSQHHWGKLSLNWTWLIILYRTLWQLLSSTKTSIGG